MEANVGRSSAKMLTKYAALFLGSLKLASRPGIFTNSEPQCLTSTRWMCC